MSDLDQLLAELRNEDLLHSEKSLSNWIIRAESELLFWDSFPPAMYEALLGFFASDAAILYELSWKLLHFLQSNYELMTNAQKEQLASLLMKNFSKLKHWMVAFVAAEILGTWYANNDQDLSVFQELVAKAQPEVVPCVPHALETVARETCHEATKSKAVKLLEGLRAHPSKAVRQEAAISLDKVAKHAK